MSIAVPEQHDAGRLLVEPAEVASAVERAAARLGIEQLHAEQEQAISEVLSGRDVLMVLPTGFGKSACYQVPSMLLRQPVVVISPLLALLRDQEQKLHSRGVDCVRLDGTVRAKARREMLARIAEGGPLVIMTTPETLERDDVREALSATGIGLAAVDEAHCVSEWGHDFRPSYSRIGARLEELGGPPVLALTATATSRVRETILRALRMREEPSLITSSPHRSNLAFEVIPCDGDERWRALLRLVKRLRRPGIVYCATRREVEAVYLLLRKFDIPAYRYHGGMTDAERDHEQKRYMRPRQRTVMVATSAFGLGIDKPNIRYILHFQAAASLEQYTQEAGRAGRDGRNSNCILLWDRADRAIHEALLARSRIRPEQLYRLGRALGAWADEGREPTIEALAVSAELGPRITSALLTRIEEAGLTSREDARVVFSGSSPETIEEDARALAGQFETLRTQDSRRLDALAEYVHSDTCRAVFLATYFGESLTEPCGLCDVCRDRPERSKAFFAPLVRPEPEPKRTKRGRRTGKAGKASKAGKAAKRSGRGAKTAGGRPARPGKAARVKGQAAGTPEAVAEGGKRRGRRRRKPKPGAGRPPQHAQQAAQTGPPRQQQDGSGNEASAGSRRRRRRRRRRRGGGGRDGSGGGQGSGQGPS